MLTLNTVPSGQLPTLGELEILYQQVDSHKKLIILSTIKFSNNIQLTASQQAGITQTPYTLSISYKAMDQKELFINFVFDYTFYLAISIIIAVITVIFGTML